MGGGGRGDRREQLCLIFLLRLTGNVKPVAMFHYREQHADNKYPSLSKTNFFPPSKSFFSLVNSRQASGKESYDI